MFVCFFRLNQCLWTSENKTVLKEEKLSTEFTVRYLKGSHQRQIVRTFLNCSVRDSNGRTCISVSFLIPLEPTPARKLLKQIMFHIGTHRRLIVVEKEGQVF